MNVVNVMNCPANGIKQCCTTTNAVISVGHRLDILKINTIVDYCTTVSKENRGYVARAVYFLLLFDGSIEAPNSVCLIAGHRAALVQDKYDFSKIVFHFAFSPSLLVI